MAEQVKDTLYESITAQLFEISRQLHQRIGYPFDARLLARHLQSAIEGRFNNAQPDPPSKVLRFVTTTRVKASCWFEARMHFRLDIGAGTDVRICHLNDAFEKHLLRMKEPALESTGINIHELLEVAHDYQIIDELGNDSQLTLSQLFSLLREQGRGEAGPLTTNTDRANLAYISDADGITWSVHARWRGEGWSIAAYPTFPGGGWRANFHVFSR